MAVRFFLTISLLVAVTTAFAQEFWLKPEKYNYVLGEKLVVNFKTGGDFIGQPWNPKGSSVRALMVHHTGKSTDLSDSVKLEGNENLSYSLKAEGTYLLSFESEDILRETTPEQFNQMLKEYELDALNRRQKSNTTLEPGREYYSVMAKLIIGVDGRKDDTYNKILGWPVEILTDRNPCSLKVGDPLRFKILFDGKPVFGVRAKVWNRFQNRTTIQNIYTEKDGTFATRISSPGPWMVTVMKINPSNQPGADWQSYQGSFMFGIEK
jgi:uncharacterized GH25 family protein